MPKISKIYDKEMITQLRDVEKSIVESTLTDDVSKQMAKEAEESSVQFLEGYVKGEIKLADDAYDIMVNYLDYLSRSTSPEIKRNITNARNIYMGERYARQKQKHQQEIIQSMGELDIESLKKGNFSILDNKKKREALTSTHLLEMERIMREDTENNWSKRKNQLEDFARKRIKAVLSGEKEKDENFEQLVKTLGSYQQQDIFDRRKSDFVRSTDDSLLSPVTPRSNDEDSQLKPQGSEENLANPDKKKPSFREINQEKRRKKEKFEIAPEYPTVQQFSVLENKKKAQQLTSEELLELSDMVEQVKQAPKKYQFRTDKIENTLRSYAQSRLARIANGELPMEQDCNDLASRYGTPKQQSAVHSKDELHPSDKSDKKQISKKPWYKRAWDAVKKPVAAAAALLVIATSSFAIKSALGGENKVSDKDDAKQPLTEQTTKTNVDKSVENQANTVSYNDVQQELKKTKQMVSKSEQKAQQQVQDVQPQVQSESPAKDDIDYARRTTSFLKTITKYNKTAKEDPAQAEQNLKDAKDKLDKFVDSIKDQLPEGVSTERMAYLASFYRLFPNSEFGEKMTQMFNGENVSISTEEITKLNKKHGELGTKYVNSLNSLRANANTGR